jgi:hypothetical protein
MARYFQPISQNDLGEKLLAAMKKHEDADEVLKFQTFADAFYDSEYAKGGKYLNSEALFMLHELTPSIVKDIKVKYDTENVMGPGDNHQHSPPYGFHTLPNGLTFFGFAAGGDWESPVYTIIYFDGWKLRAYVPKDGNPWNTSTNEAYGNDDESDRKDLQKRYPNQEVPEDIDGWADFDVDKILKDIESRILPMPAKKTADTVSRRSRLKAAFDKWYCTGQNGSMIDSVGNFADDCEIAFMEGSKIQEERVRKLTSTLREVRNDIAAAWSEEESERIVDVIDKIIGDDNE